MIGKQMVISVAVTLTAACAPLEQAPLVYSSSHQIGVGVSSGTPNAPGLDVTLGYKGIDAAYVPVAVSKPCPAQTNCPNPSIDQIRVITGANDVLGDESIDQARLEGLRRDVKRLSRETTARARVIADQKSAKQKQEERNTEAARTVDAAGVALSPEAITERNRRVAEIDSQIAALTRVPPGDLAKSITSAEERQTADMATLAERQQELSNLETVRRSQSKDQKIDALSVYGSFDGQAGGNKDGASLSLGKVFSTGVAAQHLTQGLGNGSVIAQRMLCIDKLTKAAAAMGDEGKKLLARVEEICTGKLTDKP